MTMAMGCSILSSRGKNELIGTDNVDVIDTNTLNGPVKLMFKYCNLRYSPCFFLLGISNAIFFDPSMPKHKYIGYDVPFWRWEASMVNKTLEVCK